MRARRVQTSFVAVLCLAVACGTAYGSGAASGRALTQRVLKAGEFAGMKPSTPPKVVTTVAAWTQGNTSAAARFRKEGFVGGVAEQLVTPGNPNRYGLSLVVELSTKAAAKAEMTSNATSNGPWQNFSVPAIPGAIGYEGSGPDGGGRNVGFTVGRYAYVVGAGWQGGAKNAISLNTLRAAALLLYHRVNGA
jgi:hypothetical protein